MVKIINGFRGTDPTATVLSQLGRQMFGNRTANELRREKLYAAQRGNTEMDNLVGHVANNGAHNLGSNPLAQAMIIGSGYSPDKFGKLGLMGAATSQGAESEAAQNWQVGTGQSFRNTATAFNRDLAEKARANSLASADRRYNTDRVVSEDARQFNLKPLVTIGEDGMPAYSGQLEAVQTGAMAPISGADAQGVLRMQNFDNAASLDPAQRAIIGANEGGSWFNLVHRESGRTYLTKDGKVDKDGNLIPPGEAYKAGVEASSAEEAGMGEKMDRDLINSRISTDIAVDAIDEIVGKLQVDDAGSAIGFLGTGATLINNARAQFEALGREFDLDGEIAESDAAVLAGEQSQAMFDGVANAIQSNPQAMQRLQQLGVNSAILKSNIQDLAFIIAKAQGNPGDRLSENDVMRAARTIGANLQDPVAMQQVLADLKGRLNRMQVIRERNIHERRPGTFTPRTDAPTAPAAPLASGTSSSGVSWTVVGE
jgi:hypothetical protein